MSDSMERLQLIKYALLQTTIGPSIACDLLVLSYLIRHWRKEIVTVPQNHIIFVLLIVSFIQKITDQPMTLYLLHGGVVFQQTNIFCILWGWVDYSLLTVSLDLVTWCSIERHLFVFHSQLMKKTWCLVLFHYLPIMICLLYTPSFYLVVIAFPSMCTNVWDYTWMYCGGGCYGYDPFWGSFDWLFHYASPVLIIVLSNFILVFRFIRHKTRHRQPVQWKRQRRMIIQLAFICLLYLVLMSPEIILGVIEALWLPTFGLDVQINYFYYICNFINQFLPFVIVSSLPGMRHELYRWYTVVRRYFGGAIRVQPLESNTRMTVRQPSRVPATRH